MKRGRNTFDEEEFIDDKSYLKVQFDRAEVFIQIITAIRELVPGTVTFQFDEDGIYLQEMDSAHISIVSLSIPRDSFTTYICNKNQAVSIDIEKTWPFFKGLEKDAVVLLSVSNEEFLNVEIRSNSMCSHFKK